MTLKMTAFDRYTNNVPDISLSGKEWRFSDASLNNIQYLMDAHDIPEIVARILAQKGFLKDEAHTFLYPKLKNLLPDPFLLKDMDKGVNATVEAITEKQSIAIFADYDVDGATSSALLRRYFRDIGIETELYIPDRLDEGYGPNCEAMETLHQKGVNLVLMADCGTLSFKPLQHAHDIGLKVVVLDHHLSDKILPVATALINPNRFDENFDHVSCDSTLETNIIQHSKSLFSYTYLKDLCAAGVSFLFLVALQKRLREQGYFEKQGLSAPDLMNYLDLVALGTVCDVMPLTYLNRAFVSHGLKLINQRRNKGIAALMAISKCAPQPTSHHLGFMVGPRVNAGGRVGESWMGSKLLFSNNDDDVKQYSERLHALNQERQALEKTILQDAYTMIENHNLMERPVILIAHKEWHPGVIGIVASRLKEQYNKPSLVVSYMMDACEGKGSGRSISGVSLGNAMHEAVKRGLLLQGGGHAMAAGFSVHRDAFDAFYDFLCDHLKEGVDAYVPSLTMSGFLSLSSLTIPLIKSLSLLEPFGQGNPSPKFVIGPLNIRFVDVFGGEHLRLGLEDHFGNRIKAVHFKGLHTPYGERIRERRGRFYFAGSPKIDSWSGREDISFQIDDVAEAL